MSPISKVVKAYGVRDDGLCVGGLRNTRDTHGGGPDTELTLTERARLAQLERENRELRAEAAFLKKQRRTLLGSGGSGEVRVHRFLGRGRLNELEAIDYSQLSILQPEMSPA